LRELKMPSIARGTDGSNPSPSSGELRTHLWYSIRNPMTGRENSGTNAIVGCLSACNPPLITVGFHELGAEEKDLGRVINPHEDDNERASGPVGRRHYLLLPM